MDVTSYDELLLEMKNSEHEKFVVMCYKDFCPPCKSLKPLMKKLAAFYQNLTIYKFNMQNPDIKFNSVFKIMGVPTLLFLDKTGREVLERHIGGKKKPIKQKMNQFSNLANSFS